MKITRTVINGFKVRICRVHFCIGIGMDQFTPVYHRFTTGQSLGPVKTWKNSDDLPQKNIKPQGKSLATTNYNKRARHTN